MNFQLSLEKINKSEQKSKIEKNMKMPMIYEIRKNNRFMSVRVFEKINVSHQQNAKAYQIALKWSEILTKSKLLECKIRLLQNYLK